ncbi:MAG TPA: haloacid dehalogenase type II [Aestuariivirgaceae bacterium]|jgi:2-haloalkanoic acid dehalogenase type II
MQHHSFLAEFKPSFSPGDSMGLTDFKVLTFDCYGTLIDWESGMMEALQPLTRKLKRNLSRNQILEAHAKLESSQQQQTPTMAYSNLLSVVYKRLAEEWGVPVRWEDCTAYGQSIRNWPAFSDSAEALDYLKEHYKLAILSNVDNQSFMHSNAKLKVAFDAIYTAEDVGSYKPDRRNFEYMIERLADHGFTKSDILHTAESLFHDHQPAQRLGIASCWIYRRHAQEGFGATIRPDVMPNPNFRFTSLNEMVKAHQAEMHKSLS